MVMVYPATNTMGLLGSAMIREIQVKGHARTGLLASGKVFFTLLKPTMPAGTGETAEEIEHETPNQSQAQHETATRHTCKDLTGPCDTSASCKRMT